MLLFALNNWRGILLGAIVLILGTTAAYYRWQANRWEAKYEAYVAEVAAVAAAAAERTKATEAKNKKEKELADAKNAARLADLRTANQRLRDEIARGGILPPAAPGAADPGRASFDRADLERTLRKFAEGVADLVREGDEARAGLDTAREWARETR
jgi:hypothetical protein